MATHGPMLREPLRAQEADALSHACETTEEKLIIWTLIDTGLRVSELCISSQHGLWQQKALRIQGKGGPYGKRSNIGWCPCPGAFNPCWSITLPCMQGGLSDLGRCRKLSNG